MVADVVVDGDIACGHNSDLILVQILVDEMGNHYLLLGTVFDLHFEEKLDNCFHCPTSVLCSDLHMVFGFVSLFYWISLQPDCRFDCYCNCHIHLDFLETDHIHYGFLDMGC